MDTNRASHLDFYCCLSVPLCLLVTEKALGASQPFTQNYDHGHTPVYGRLCCLIQFRYKPTDPHAASFWGQVSVICCTHSILSILKDSSSFYGMHGHLRNLITRFFRSGLHQIYCAKRLRALNSI